MDIHDLLHADVAADLALLFGETCGQVDDVAYSISAAAGDLVVTASTGGHERTFRLMVLETPPN